ncbi:MAG: acetolactate synthase small subunit, partial [Pseudomonadales bacterium]
IERELMLIKVRASGAQRSEVKRCADIFRGQIVDVGPTIFVIQVTGASDKLDAFIEAIGEASILEVVRSGVSGIARGEKILRL